MSRSLRILLVDDEAWKARSVERWLRACASGAGRSVHVTHVTTAFAIMALRADDYDAVVSDWNLPGGGAAVVRWAAEHDLPVVVISGSDRPADWTDTRTRWWAPQSRWLDGARWIVQHAAADVPSLEVCG